MTAGLRAKFLFSAFVVALVAILASCLMAVKPAGAQERTGLVACPTMISADQRLVMEQWAADGNCRRPTRTRIVDRYLGYSCVEDKPADARCRAHLPGPDSRAFDTSKHYRCLDLDITAGDGGAVITQMREWVAPRPTECDWDPNRNILPADIDFANSQVCIAALCLPVARLSAIGKVRLRHTIEHAFRELGLTPKGDEAKAVALAPGRVTKSLSPITAFKKAGQ